MWLCELFQWLSKALITFPSTKPEQASAFCQAHSNSKGNCSWCLEGYILYHMVLPPLVIAHQTKRWHPTQSNQFIGWHSGLCLVLMRKDRMTKQIPPGNVLIWCPEAKQLASAVEPDRIQRDKVKMHEPKKQAKRRRGKEMMSRKKKPGNTERGREHSTEKWGVVWSTWLWWFLHLAPRKASHTLIHIH